MATQFDHRTHLDVGEDGNPWRFAAPFLIALTALVTLFSVWFAL